MKINLLKLSFAFAGIAIAGINGYAQSPASSRICIKIDEIVNGKTIKIDTCFIGLGSDEIQNRLAAMGISDMQRGGKMGNSTYFLIDKEGNGADSVSDKVIIINDGKDGQAGDGKVEEISIKNNTCNTITLDKDGYAYSTTDAGRDSSVNTEVIVKKGNDDSNHNEVRIYVYSKKINVEDVSDSDRLKIGSGINTEPSPFAGLKIYPDPAASAINVSYTTSSTELLKINIYDVNGKTVYTEKINQTGEQVNETISLSSLSPGIYFVSLTQGNEGETRKIIVQ